MLTACQPPAANPLAAVEAEVAAGGTIIKAMPGSRANHAGSFLVSWKQPDA